MITVRRCFAAARLGLRRLGSGTVGSRVRLGGRVGGHGVHEAAVHDRDVRLRGALGARPARLAHASVGVRAEPVARTVERHVVRRTLGAVQVRVDARASFVDANLRLGNVQSFDVAMKCSTNQIVSAGCSVADDAQVKRLGCGHRSTCNPAN